MSPDVRGAPVPEAALMREANQRRRRRIREIVALLDGLAFEELREVLLLSVWASIFRGLT